MKITGQRRTEEDMTNRVFIDGRELDPARSQRLNNHSPDGFDWGYHGSGPAQLALALLLEFSDERTALTHYQNFKERVIAGLPGGKNFSLDAVFVKEFIKIAEKDTENA